MVYNLTVLWKIQKQQHDAHIRKKIKILRHFYMFLNIFHLNGLIEEIKFMFRILIAKLNVEISYQKC